MSDNYEPTDDEVEEVIAWREGRDVRLVTTECIHGLGEPAWCTICNGREARYRRRHRTGAL